ncbi:MAG: pyridoxamine 5'-phosphate oxidase family protein [Nocardioidaceae bacterium]|nr:pyridoxamine 5'-phosphate oxidase family protein [Nocardioidaceae bacterium]
MAALSPTPRTRLRRHPDRTQHDRAALLDVLDQGLICHLGVVIDGAPVVLPTVYAVDVDGPDRDGTLYLHGSVASRSLATGQAGDICVTVTHVDGLVLARSGFHHSMNYRSAVILGRGRLVDDPDERAHALDLVVDHVVPGRASTLRDHTRKELAATAVVALPLHEASVKQRSGGPIDDDEDVAAAVWAGVLPLRVVAGEVTTAADAAGLAVPVDVSARAAQLAAPSA